MRSFDMSVPKEQAMRIRAPPPRPGLETGRRKCRDSVNLLDRGRQPFPKVYTAWAEQESQECAKGVLPAHAHILTPLVIQERTFLRKICSAQWVSISS